MGTMTAQALAEDTAMELEQSVGLHLAVNFYPPLPLGYVEPLIEAICAVLEEDERRMVELPDLPLLPSRAVKIGRKWMIEAGSLVESCRAWPFVTALDEEY